MAVISEDNINVEIIEDKIEITINTFGNFNTVLPTDVLTKFTYDNNDNGIVDNSEKETIYIVAQEDLPAFSVVTVTGFLADSSNTTHFNKVAGIALQDIYTGYSGKVAVSGWVTNVNWSFVAGDILYLNGTSLSTVAPSTGFSQMIGKAINSQTILIDLKPPILL